MGFDDDEEHAEAMSETGFWGRSGAGCVVLCLSTGRFLIGRRSADVLQPGTWGTWGGAVPSGSSPEECVLRELEEETGCAQVAGMAHVYRFADSATGFRYDTYVVAVEDEFEPVLNWENDAFVWTEQGQWPDPLHFGMREVLERAGDLASSFRGGSPRLP